MSLYVENTKIKGNRATSVKVGGHFQSQSATYRILLELDMISEIR